MTDASWDNQGMGEAPRPGLPTWAKFLMGCGVLFVLLIAACVGGGYWIGQKAKRDPEGFKRGAIGIVTNQIRPDYDHAARIVNQLRTEAGSRAVWAGNPGLHEAHGSEAAFLAATAAWRPHLEDLPPLTPDLLEQNRFDLTKEPFTGIQFGYRMPDGSRLRMAWRGTSGGLTLLALDPAIAPSPTTPGEGKP